MGTYKDAHLVEEFLQFLYRLHVKGDMGLSHAKERPAHRVPAQSLLDGTLFGVTSMQRLLSEPADLLSPPIPFH